MVRYKSKPKPTFTIIIDSREQTPWKFPAGFVNTVVAGLKTGDYSILNYEDKITIERKTKSDIYQSLGCERKRFEAEFERLSKFDYPALIVECSLTELLTPPAFSSMSPKTIINSLISWSQKYKVFIFFADNPIFAGVLAYRILEKYWILQNRKVKIEADGVEES